MLRLLLAAIALLIALTVDAAVPSLAAFNNTQFGTSSTTGNRVHLKSGAVITNAALAGYFTLSGQTNQITDSGTALQFNGSDIGAGTVGTMINAGTPVSTAIPVYSGTTGTNIVPSSVTIAATTNLTAGTLTSTTTITTGDPGGGAGALKVGVWTGELTVTANLTNAIKLNINGTNYWVLIANEAP